MVPGLTSPYCRSVRRNVIPFDFKVYAADDTPISTYGIRRLTLNFGLRHPYTYKFIVAQVQQPIIGADFLKYHGLLIDLKNRQIIDDYTKLQLAQISTNSHQSITTLCKRNNNDKYIKLLKEYIEVTRPTQRLNPPKHTIYHHIIT